MISCINIIVHQVLQYVPLTPQRISLKHKAAEAQRDGKIRVIIYLSSVRLHLNFVQDLLNLLSADSQFLVMIACSFPIKDIEIPRDIIRIPDISLIRSIPVDFLLTMDEGVPILHHRNTQVIHIPHSLASMHVIYPEGAFDHFAYIFCAGSHHLQELKTMLVKRKVKDCVLVPAGYEIVDRLSRTPQNPTNPPTIVFAPSWGPDNALSMHGLEIISALIDKYRIIVRPHVMSMKLDSEIIQSLTTMYDQNPHFSLDLNADSLPTLSQADVLISDWSGVAFEYSLAYLKPVIFIDGPMKVLNPHWALYLRKPGIECTHREKIGVVIRDITQLRSEIDRIVSDSSSWHEKIAKERLNLLFNPGTCAETSHRALIIMAKGVVDSGWVVV